MKYRLQTFLFLLFFSFPIVDYVLRTILRIPVVSSLWDELVLFGLLTILGWRWFIGELESRDFHRTNVSKPLLLIVLYGIALIFFNLPYFSVGLEGFRASFQYIFAFFAAFYLLREKQTIVTMIYIIVGIGLIMGLHGVYQYIAGVPMPGHWVDAGENVRTRAFSFVGSPNVLGSYMAFCVPIAIGLALSHIQSFFHNRKLQKHREQHTKNHGDSHKEYITSGKKDLGLSMLFLSIAGVMGLCLLVTFSRGALLALAVSLVVVAIIIATIYDKRTIIGVLGAGVVAIGLVYVLAPTVVERLLYVFSPEYLTKSAQGGRITRWLNAFDRMRHEPFFGAGLGQYGGAVGARHFGTIYVDNYYAKTLAEMGLVGISLFLWLMSSLVKNGYQAWRSVWDSSYRFLAAGLFSGLFAVILHNGVENIFEVPFMNVLFWLTAGILLALPFLQEDQNELANELAKQELGGNAQHE
ncbi:hypothetical protein BHU72_05150 [Desulfuribacillus stibiiarsenatis]|uniref:O-antigen ligase-related domain-containing protein n=1 Tax=Desulfuribacillus stibiiarsenatis TaxID=1390249 RepID=A0A1E5L5Y1_9FIRM|nr:O-antigen ligase family protein [Desulfuribacillus stibiiarsenatis]OEH85474.1 hypothetical protein BHU72_05150 [Desulfuribacillus stibiiarsenatis]